LLLDGEDIRRSLLKERRERLGRLLRKAKPGIRLSEHIEADGATVFAHACKLGLEGIVSKRVDAPYRSGRARTWIKVKNEGCQLLGLKQTCAGQPGISPFERAYLQVGCEIKK
jgi:ATP-dependent DNA ligase